MEDSVRAEFFEAMLDQMAGGGLRQAQSERGGLSPNGVGLSSNGVGLSSNGEGCGHRTSARL